MKAAVPLTDADYRALGDFRFHIRRFLHFSENAAHAEGLEPQQHQMLLAIRACGETAGCTIGTLAESLLIRHHSAVGLVDRLEARGLIERIRGTADRREVLVRLTADGANRLERLSDSHRKELRTAAPVLVEALTRIAAIANHQEKKL